MFKNLLLITLMLATAHTALAQQPTKEELQRRTQALLRELDAVKKDLDNTRANKKKSLGDLKQLERKIQMRNQVITNIKTEVWMVEREILKTYREIDTLKKELDVLKDQYAQSIVYAYKTRSNYDFLNFLFSSSNFSDALKRLSYLKTYRNYRTQKAADILRTNQVLNDKIQSLSLKRKEKSVALDAQAKQIAELEKEKKEKDAVVAEIQSREKELSKMYANKEKERRQMQAAIAAVIKREREEALRAERAAAAARIKAEEEAAALRTKEDAKRIAEGKAPAPAPITKPAPEKKPASVFDAAPEALLISKKFEENKGRLPWPVERGEITLRYGTNKVPAKMRDINVVSEGITWETAIGANVKAVFDGEVSSVFTIGNHKMVIIKHGRYFTTYGSLSSVNVSRGQTVTTGQVIGKAGVNDYGEGEVYFQLDTEAGQINPEPWLIRRQ